MTVRQLHPGLVSNRKLRLGSPPRGGLDRVLVCIVHEPGSTVQQQGPREEALAGAWGQTAKYTGKPDPAIGRPHGLSDDLA